MRRARCFVWVLTAALITLRLVAAAAQPRADLDHGKTIRLIVGAPAGTDEDMYGRLIAKYFGQHVEGKPTVAVINRPGGAGRAAAEVIASSLNDDGTLIGTVAPQAIAAPLWDAKPPFDPRNLGYLGSASSEITECFVGDGAQVDTVRDALIHSLKMAALTEGGPTRDGPNLLNQLIGMKFTVIAKYADIAGILAAIGENEVAGACGLTRSSISSRHPDWLPKGVLHSLVQESTVGAPFATRIGIPRMTQYLASAADREVASIAYAPQAFGRPFILPPRTQPAQVKLLRRAFMDTLRDDRLVAEARGAHLEIDALSGESVAALVNMLYSMPPQSVERFRETVTALAER